MRILSALLVGCLIFTAAGVARADMEQDRAEGIAWLLQHQNGDGSWGEGGAKAAATAEVLSALRHAGAHHGPHYSRGLAWLSNARTDSADSLARKIIALKAAGWDAQTMGLVNELLNKRNAFNTWGALTGYDGGLPDSALAMEAIRVSGTVYSDTDKYRFLNLVTGTYGSQKDGNNGWPYIGGYKGRAQDPRIMPTGYNLVALAELKKQGWTIQSEIERGVRWLLDDKKQPDGSFLDDSGVATGAVHKTALAYLGIDAARSGGIEPPDTASALADARSYLLGRQETDGSWGADPYQSALALRTLPETAMVDGDQDGIPDAVEIILGTDPGLADAHMLISGNGLASDLSAEALLVEVLSGEPFAHSYTAAGGTPPYNWSHASGAFPPGIGPLPSGGTLSGTPTTPGYYVFTISVSDAVGTKRLVGSHIRVLDPGDVLIDIDADDLADAYELANGLDPLDPDTDTDGLTDGYELAFGYDPLNFDTDGDNTSDGAEVAAGRNPLLNEPMVLTIINLILLDD